ncbi:Uncharacterised protein [Campylobacter hominis]|uniref:Uncharacterized protein n=1 Tax=Campylobacter hominis (strain ATCC BAA-381 / DSM 21671 / CCUG 45161 / LMG 19568 / NCTC 13146 / CH001A) TaxID=360107 RepID=A7I0L2_CAMHC|nr:hypothetical protein CHAB381_0465 [Campylobacter hominis ATCC BAA-381]SUW84600.1 Uncharacterised protein [Campylobacter hominis]
MNFDKDWKNYTINDDELEIWPYALRNNSSIYTLYLKIII